MSRPNDGKRYLEDHEPGCVRRTFHIETRLRDWSFGGQVLKATVNVWVITNHYALDSRYAKIFGATEQRHDGPYIEATAVLYTGPAANGCTVPRYTSFNYGRRYGI